MLTVCVPDVVFVPLQPLEAVQDVAFVLDHVSVELPPVATLSGFPENVSVGADAACTVTVALRVGLLPPGPLHTSV